MFFLINSCISYVVLGRAQSKKYAELNNGTFLYSNHSPTVSELARSIGAGTSVKVLEIHSPGAGRLAMKLTGTKVISNPTLVVHGKSGLEIYSGGVAVEDALKPFSGIDSPLSQGRIAIIALACIVLVFTIIGDEIGFFSSLNAFLGLVVVGGLWSHCLLGALLGSCCVDGKGVVVSDTETNCTSVFNTGCCNNLDTSSKCSINNCAPVQCS